MNRDRKTITFFFFLSCGDGKTFHFHLSFPWQRTAGTSRQLDLRQSSGSSTSETEGAAVARETSFIHDELSMDELRPHSVETATVQSSVPNTQFDGSGYSKVPDLPENISECQSAEPSSFSESSSMNETMCMEVSAVDSSAEVSEEGSENFTVGCSDEASLMNTGRGSSVAGRSWPEQERVVECSSASSEVEERLQQVEADVSEGTLQEEEAVDDDIGGNEATSKVCDTGHSGLGLPVLFPHSTPAECLVNSSQDVAWTSSVEARTSSISCSPSQGEAECYNSSDCIREVFNQGTSGERDRGRVSSAQDSSLLDFSCVIAADPEGLGLSDTEYGPSSSTQVVPCASMRTDPGWRREHGADDMVCNSSDASAPCLPPRHAEDSNVDSTTQNGLHVTHTEAGPQPGCAEEGMVITSPSFGENDVGIFCDSNSDRGAFSEASDETVGVTSGPADSQSSEVLHTDPLISIADSSLAGPLRHDSREEEPDIDHAHGSRQVSSASVNQLPLPASISDQLSVQVTPSASSDVYNLSPSLDSCCPDQLVSMSSCCTPASTEGSQDVTVSSRHSVDSSRQCLEHIVEASTSSQSTTMQQEGVEVQMPESSVVPGSGTSEDCEGLVCRVHSQGITSMFFGEDSVASACSSQPSTSMSVSSSEAQPALSATPALKKKVFVLWLVSSFSPSSPLIYSTFTMIPHLPTTN